MEITIVLADPPLFILENTDLQAASATTTHSTPNAVFSLLRTNFPPPKKNFRVRTVPTGLLNLQA